MELMCPVNLSSALALAWYIPGRHIHVPCKEAEHRLAGLLQSEAVALQLDKVKGLLFIIVSCKFLMN